MEKSLSEIALPNEEAPDQQSHTLGVIGVSFKTAEIETRERLAKRITPENFSELVTHDQSLKNCELVLLSTCNRIEIYYYGNELSLTTPLRNLLEAESSGATDIYHLRADQAATHLFNVATGLDSLVVGEAQILAQVNEASKQSADHGLSGEVMSRFFSKAYETARTVREQNPGYTNGMNYSVSHAVMELISKEYGDKKPNLLLIGSGKMIRLAVSAIERSNLGKIIVASRKKTIENFKPDSVIGMGEIPETIATKGIDVVITATSAEDYILRREDFKHNAKPVLILDISVPRNVDPGVGKLPNVTLLNLDDMKDKIGNSVEQETDLKLREELSRGVAEFLTWLADYEEVVPLLSSLRRRAEVIRIEELTNAFSRMPNLTDAQRATIEKMSERLLKRFLHEPTIRLKSLSRTEGNDKAKIYAEVISELFSSKLDKPAGA